MSQKRKMNGAARMLKFADMGLDNRILEAIVMLGWNEPTIIQEKAIPLALEGSDILARASTGSGKTAVFAIPVIHKILHHKQTLPLEQKGTGAIVVAPSEELCHQLREHISKLASCCVRKIKCIDVTSGELDEPLVATIPDIVVGTPARLLDLIQAGSLPGIKKTLKSFVAYQSDRLFGGDFEDDTQDLIHKVVPKRGCQLFLLSATTSPSLINLRNLAFNKPVIVEENEPVSNSTSPPQNSNCPKDSGTFSYIKNLILTALIIIPLVSIILNNTSQGETSKSGREQEIKINLEQVDRLNQKYPGLLSAKEMRLIKARIAVMEREVSILMLLGKSRDNHCKLDPTFCVGQTIANVTQLQFGYIDASDPFLNSNELKRELVKALDSYKSSVIIDSLERLPGTEVMNLFQFIDKDETHRRRGMLILIVYTGLKFDEPDLSRLKEADLAERVLVDSWSQYIPRDSLTSILSRMCGSIVKVY